LQKLAKRRGENKNLACFSLARKLFLNELGIINIWPVAIASSAAQFHPLTDGAESQVSKDECLFCFSALCETRLSQPFQNFLNSSANVIEKLIY
jgi:hypothetical protein